MPDTSQDAQQAKLIDDLKSELDEVYRANDRTAAAYDEAIQQRDKLSDECETLSEKLDVLETELTAASKSNQHDQDLASKIQSLEQENSQLTSNQRNLEDKLENLKKHFDSVCHSKSQLEKELSRLSKTNETLASRESHLTEELASTKSSLVDRDKSIADNAEIERVLREELANARTTNESILAQSAKDAEAFRDGLERSECEKSDLQEAVDRLTRDLSSRDVHTEKQNETNSALRSKLQVTLTQLDEQSAINSRLQTEVHDLNTLCEQLQSDRDLLLTSVTRHTESLESQLSDTQTRLEESQIRIRELENQKVVLREEARSTAISLRHTESLLNRFVKDLERAGSDICALNADLSSERREKGDQIDRLNSDIQFLNSQVVELRSKADQKESELTIVRQANSELRDQLADRINPNLGQTAEIGDASVQEANERTSQLGQESPKPNKPNQVRQNEEPDLGKTKRKSTAKRKQAINRKKPVDDLTVISGVGPKIRDVLASKKIATFKKLASTDVARLERILKGAGLSLKRFDPSGWPEEARIAASGNIARLKELQKNRENGWVGRYVRPVH